MWLMLTGLLLSLLSGGGAAAMDTAARVCLAAAVALFIASALLRPRALRAEAAGRVAGMEAVSAAPQCGFGDVAANEEAKKSLEGLVDYLKDPQKYARYGARMPRGVLLYGPPGTGKTLLARALAGEAGVPFFALSGSDFVQMYVGVGASRVRELFKSARKAGKCVIFIDEIDAMAKKRDEQSSDERDQTLNALLSEMSGFRPSEGIIVLAATNRLDTLDPALLRPGRFDRQIEVGLPGREERLSILRLHSRNKPLSRAVDLEALAGDTSCFSGASLENLLNEAAIAAAGRGAEAIEPDDVRGAFYKTVAGADRKSTATRAERRVIAVHEAGHALASLTLTPENRLRRVSILPAGGGAAGYNLSIPPERTMLEKRQIERQIEKIIRRRGKPGLNVASGDRYLLPCRNIGSIECKFVVLFLHGWFFVTLLLSFRWMQGCTWLFWAGPFAVYRSLGLSLCPFRTVFRPSPSGRGRFPLQVAPVAEDENPNRSG